MKKKKELLLITKGIGHNQQYKYSQIIIHTFIVIMSTNTQDNKQHSIMIVVNSNI